MESSYGWGSAVASAVLLASAADAAPKLTKGYYGTHHYVVSATVSGSGSCLDPAGSTYDSEVYYPGPDKAGAKERRQFNNDGVLQIEITTLPKTPAAGVSTWSGDYSSVFEPSGNKFTGTFKTTLNPTDAFSNVGTTTLVYQVEGGGTCTTSIQVSQFYYGA
jgi:hypothetical protein